MKIKCEIELDLDSGEFSIDFWNLAHPKDDIDYDDVVDFVATVFEELNERIEDSEAGIERETKILH